MAAREKVEDRTAKRKDVDFGGLLLSAVHFRRVVAKRSDLCASLHCSGAEGLIRVSGVDIFAKSEIGNFHSPIEAAGLQ